MTKKQNVIFILLFWLAIVVLFFLAILQSEPIYIALKLATLMILPLIIPVHLHEYLFENFFLKKKYLPYSIFTLIDIFLFGFLIKEMQKLIEPAGNMETYMSILFFMFLYLGIKYVIHGTKQRFRIKELEAKQAQIELNLLKSQVKPHFLFNSLNSIYSLVLKKSDDSARAVMLLSDLMRYILESGPKKMLPLKEELEFIKNYIELEKIRLGEDFKMNFVLKGESNHLIIAPMILISFVENVFKHGVGTRNEGVKIEIVIEDSKLTFISENKLVQHSHNLESKKEKTGIANVIKRLELIYPKRYKLDISQANEMFVVHLQIDLKEEWRH